MNQHFVYARDVKSLNSHIVFVKLAEYIMVEK